MRKDDGNTRAVQVRTQESQPDTQLSQVQLHQPVQASFEFHPQQVLLHQFPITYKPGQVPFHPRIPEGNVDSWKKMMQWAQPGFYSCYSAQSYQHQGNYWAGVCLSAVAKQPT